MSASSHPERVVPADYFVDAYGVWRDLGEKRPPLQLTLKPVYVTALLRNVDAVDWSVEIEFINPDGQTLTLLIPYSVILERNQLAQLCVDAGLLVLPRGLNEFAEYLAQCVGDPELPRDRLVSKLGFNELSGDVCLGGLVFVLPDRTLIPTQEEEMPPAERLVFRPNFPSPGFSAYTSAGTLEESRELLRLVEDDPVAIFTLCASLAAPFLELSGVDSVIVHLYGNSSTGKTTRLQLAGMLWGTPLDPQTTGNKATLIERWHGTANSMENLAATHNGMVLCLDELGGNTDQAFSIYNQTSGRGKNRMTRDGGVQAQRKWSLLIISTGELSLAERLEAGTGKPAKTGEIIRGLSIPLDDLPAYEGLTTEEAGNLIQEVKTRLTQAYGTIGPAFVQAVLDKVSTLEPEPTTGLASVLSEQLQYEIQVQHERLVEKARAEGHQLKAPHIRALRRFALVGVIGEWAANDYLPFTEIVIKEAIDRVALTWLGTLPLLNDEDRMVGQIRDWIIRHLGQMIQYGAHSVSDGPYIPNTTKGIRHLRWILLTEESFKEACAGFSHQVAGKLLKRLGILDCEQGKHKQRHTLSGLNLPATYFYSILIEKLLTETELADSLAAGPLPTTNLGPRRRTEGR